MQALGRVLVGRVHPGEHLDVAALHERGAVVVGDRQAGDLGPGRAGLDGGEDLLHRRDVTDG